MSAALAAPTNTSTCRVNHHNHLKSECVTFLSSPEFFSLCEPFSRRTVGHSSIDNGGNNCIGITVCHLGVFAAWA